MTEMKRPDIEKITITPNNEKDAKTALILEGLLNHLIDVDSEHYQMAESEALERLALTGSGYMRTVTISKDEFEAMYPRIEREFIRPEYWYRDPWDVQNIKLYVGGKGNRTLISMAVRWAWGINE